MAKYRKRYIPPSSFEVTAPATIVPLMQAFHVATKEVAQALIIETVRTISGNDALLSKEELISSTSLMNGIKPCDNIETLYAAQIVVSHMLGMRKLSGSYPDDQKLGIKLLRFSNKAMQQLGRKRNEGDKSITVNYSYQGVSHAYPRS